VGCGRRPGVTARKCHHRGGRRRFAVLPGRRGGPIELGRGLGGGCPRNGECRARRARWITGRLHRRARSGDRGRSAGRACWFGGGHSRLRCIGRRCARRFACGHPRSCDGARFAGREGRFSGLRCIGGRWARWFAGELDGRARSGDGARSAGRACRFAGGLDGLPCNGGRRARRFDGQAHAGDRGRFARVLGVESRASDVAVLACCGRLRDVAAGRRAAAAASHLG
jgi:hypothetical protein